MIGRSDELSVTRIVFLLYFFFALSLSAVQSSAIFLAEAVKAGLAPTSTSSHLIQHRHPLTGINLDEPPANLYRLSPTKRLDAIAVFLGQ